jgi:putative ABC transport system permease protein
VRIRTLLVALWRNKTGPLLVSAQVAITLALIVNVAYVVEQRIAEISKPTGLDVDNIFWLQVKASSKNYPYANAVKADLSYLNSLPGVVAATTTNNVPETNYITGLPFAPTLESLQKGNDHFGAQIIFGTDKYIDAMGLKLIAGRTFDPGAIKPPAADWNAALGNWADEVIVTQSFAKRLFPDGNALGKPIYVGLINKSSTIVGIVELLRTPPEVEVYDYFATQIVIAPIIPAGPNVTYVVRAKPGQRDRLMAQIEKDFADFQPGRYIAHMEDLTRTAENARRELKANATILAVVAALVLVVTIVGISGLAAFNVSSRTKQLGVRRAIGARKSHILRYFLVENWIITTCGAAVGSLLALIAGVKLSTMYEMSRAPLYYLVGGIVLMWIIGLLAVWVPARRAASISPAVATRAV